MTIGIDLSVLQGPHRMRGVGYTLLNCINHVDEDFRKTHSFVFYMYDTEEYGNPLELLNLDGLMYESRIISPLRTFSAPKKLPKPFKLVFSLLNQLSVLRDIYLGDSRIKDLKGVDHFLQFDQTQPVPSKRKIRSTIIVYDLVPYVMEADYLWSYRTARINGSTRKGALRREYQRRRWVSKVRMIVNRAYNLVAISEHTKKDFIKYLRIKPAKITVCLLGVSPLNENRPNNIKFKEFVSTSWGPVPRDVTLEGKEYMLFIGGADPRRQLIELVAAYNNLRAQGSNIHLVLAGDTMMGPFEIPNLPLQRYFKNTSYLEDIIFLGFVNDAQREWLYKNAVAFVYPSVYEGFGLPVLEAMQHGTPVITYDNSSITEVAGDAAIYVSSFLEIAGSISKLGSDDGFTKKYRMLGMAQAKKYQWSKTSRTLFDHISR